MHTKEHVEPLIVRVSAWAQNPRSAKLRRGAYCSEGAILAKKRFSLDDAPSLLSDAPHLTTCLTWQHVRLAERLI